MMPASAATARHRYAPVLSKAIRYERGQEFCEHIVEGQYHCLKK